MKLVVSLLILGIVWLLVTIWDVSSLAWSPRTLLYFIDIPQLIYVALPAVLVTGIVASWSATVSGIALGFGMLKRAEKEDAVKGARALKILGQLALSGGAVITLIEAVISAHNSVSLAGFLPALGVSMLAVLYGIVIRIGCGLGVQIIKVRLGPFVFYTE